MSLPAFTVLENCLLRNRVPPPGVPSLKRKWLKNLIRTCLVAFTILMAIIFQSSLDVFLGYLSTLACTPVGFIFPAAYHLILAPTKQWERGLDWFIIVFGVVAMVGCTVISIISET